MKVAEHRQTLRDSSLAELQAMLETERKNLFTARLSIASKQLENPMMLRNARKNIARILTVIRERELESERGRA